MTVVQDTVKTSVQQICDSAVRVDVQYVLRPSEDEALRAADIGASGVSEVILARQADWESMFFAMHAAITMPQALKSGHPCPTNWLYCLYMDTLTTHGPPRLSAYPAGSG